MLLLVALALWGLLVSAPDTPSTHKRAPLPPLVPVPVQIPDGVSTRPPFDVPRNLTVPTGFGVHLYARVPNARFVLVLPSGDALVSQPKRGEISLLKAANASGEASAAVTTFVRGLRSPHDMVLARLDGLDYLYVSESHAVSRYPYSEGATEAGIGQEVVTGLPDDAQFRHPLKNIAVGNGTLFVAIGSASNDSPDDLLAHEPKCGAIYGYPLTASGGGVDAKQGQLVSAGVRNAEGLAFAPGTDHLWVVVNQRDNVKYPYHDADGRFGQVVAEYVDENPPEEFSRIVWGRNYGWPYCNPVPSDSMDDLEYVADAEHNPDGSVKDCSQFERVAKGMEPHSAPLGLTFWAGDAVPEPFRDGALVGMHGSWNRRTYSGHKVAFFPWEQDGRPGKAYDLVTGWVTDPKKKVRWGRPVDTGVLPDGSLLITDDLSGAVYRLYEKKKQ